MYEVPIFIALGLIIGIASGLLGIGGGIILIPSLFYIFSLIHVDPSIQMQMAIGTSLASVVISTLSSSIANYKRSTIIFSIVFFIGIGSACGSIFGAYLVSSLPQILLRYLFCFFTCFLGIRCLLSKQKTHVKRSLPKKPLLILMGFVISSIATVLGIAGGILNVPILSYFSIPIRKAIGTSSALAFIVACISSISLFLIDSHMSETSSLIYWPAFFWISITTPFAAPLGVRLAHYFHPDHLKKILGVILVTTGIILILA